MEGMCILNTKGTLKDLWHRVLLNRHEELDDSWFRSEVEKLFYKELTKVLPGIQVNSSVGGRVPDFSLPNDKIFFEIYGYTWHSGEVKMEEDAIRMRELGLRGWVGWVFMENEIRADPKGCALIARRLVEETRKR